MSRPFKSNKQGGSTVNFTGKNKPSEFSSDIASNNLWVGNLAADVSESDLRNLFEKYGGVDNVTCYPSRNYAFIYLKRAEDAKRARAALQGMVLRGNPLRIDFAKPAKPCKSLWVSGISASISKEDLEEEFSKFGNIEDFKFLRDKNTLFIDYVRLEDASKALKAMHGKKKGGSLIRVDYLRSHPRRDQGPDFREPEGQRFRNMGPFDAPWLQQDPFRNYPDPLYYGSKRPQHILPPEGRKGDGNQPSNVLIISYPPAVLIDEHMLHNAIILFGEIEKIRSFPSRCCSFVEFRSVEEAQRAKEGLQGKLFNDPRILITFSTNEFPPNQDFGGFLPGVKGPRPDALFHELPFQGPPLDVFGPPAVPNGFHGRVARGVGGPDIPRRPFGPPGSFEPIFPGPEFGADPIPIDPIHGLNRRSSPTKRMLSSPSAGMNPSAKPGPGAWDVFDASHIQREPKRLRTDGAMPLKETDGRILPTDQTHKGVPQVKGVGPSNTRFKTASPDIDRPDADCMWRGIIAKGGTPVCRARCVPVGDWIGYEIPEIVNCSARTGLDMLAKHYTDAVGFDIIFFLPDSEDDFASYTEFLRYLGDRNRAGVAKFDDGTTLFLVPPSDFLTKVLKVSGPERLYGVVLKFPQHASNDVSDPPVSHSQYPSQIEYGAVPQDDKILQNRYGGGVSREYPKPQREPLGPPTSNPQPVHFVPPVVAKSTPPAAGLPYNPQPMHILPPVTSTSTPTPQAGLPYNPQSVHFAPPTVTSTPPAGLPYNPQPVQFLPPVTSTSTSTPQVGLSLTPELIATLASLAKVNSTAQQPSGHTVAVPPVRTPGAPEEPPFQGWRYEREHVGSTFQPQPQPQTQPQNHAYSSNIPHESHLEPSGKPRFQDPTFGFPHHREPVPPITSSSYQTPQGGHFAPPMQTSQQYQPDYPQNPDPPLAFQPSLSHAYGTNVYEPQNMVPVGVENSGVQQLQTSELDADKNERYQSTLQFAANLLLQIHQRQPGNEAGQTDRNR